jgi:CheY-like chemotaxis protein
MLNFTKVRQSSTSPVPSQRRQVTLAASNNSLIKGTDIKCPVPVGHTNNQDSVSAELLAQRLQVLSASFSESSSSSRSISPSFSERSYSSRSTPSSSCERSDISRLTPLFEEQVETLPFTHDVAYVEDCSIMTMTHNAVFKKNNVNVIFYDDGETFLDAVAKKAINPRVLLMDFSLGSNKLNGSEVVARIRADGLLPDTVILGYSNNPERHSEFMEAGADDSILKDGGGLLMMASALRAMTRNN